MRINTLYLRKARPAKRATTHGDLQQTIPLFGAENLQEADLETLVRDGRKKNGGNVPVAVSERQKLNFTVEADDKAVPKTSGAVTSSSDGPAPLWLAKIRLAAEKSAKSVMVYWLGDLVPRFLVYHIKAWGQDRLMVCSAVMSDDVPAVPLVRLPTILGGGGGGFVWLTVSQVEEEYERSKNCAIAADTPARQLETVWYGFGDSDMTLQFKIKRTQRIELSSKSVANLAKLIAQKEEQERRIQEAGQKQLEEEFQKLEEIYPAEEHMEECDEQDIQEAEAEQQDDTNAGKKTFTKTQGHMAPGTFVTARTQYYYMSEREHEIKTVFYPPYKDMIQRPYSFTSKTRDYGGRVQTVFVHLLWCRKKLRPILEQTALAGMDVEINGVWNGNGVLQYEARLNEGYKEMLQFMGWVANFDEGCGDLVGAFGDGNGGLAVVRECGVGCGDGTGDLLGDCGIRFENMAERLPPFDDRMDMDMMDMDMMDMDMMDGVGAYEALTTFDSDVDMVGEM